MNPNQTVECIAPFSSIFFSIPTYAYPCCVIIPNKESEISLNDSVQSNFHRANKNYRKQFISFGKDFSKYKDCKACIDGGKSTTQRDLHNAAINPDINYIENPTLTNLHIKFSNLCNLACRMCDGNSSNLIFKEQKLHPSPSIKLNEKMVLENIPKDSILYQSILQNLDKLRFLWFSGGETLLHEQVWIILNRLYDNNLSKNITLQINTNGTVKLSDKEISILQSFKKLNLHISIDGIGTLAEYIRTNLNWEVWSRNFKIYYDNFKKLGNCDLQLVTTISTFNIHKIAVIEDFFINNYNMSISKSFVYGPRPETAAYNLSLKNKDYLYTLYKDYIFFNSVYTFLNTNTSTIASSKVCELIDKRDKNVIKRSLYKNFIPYREVEPEWYDRLKNF